MKFRHAFLFIPCLIVSLWSAVTSARAVTITSADTITVSLGLLAPGIYPAVNIQLNFFGGPDKFDLGESYRVGLFTSGNALVSTQTIPSPANGSLASSPTLLGPVDNTGHFFIDQIVGSFDLSSILISGFDGEEFGPAFTAQFTVGQATPLPAALPLFVTGLGALGLLGWRRKRKPKAASGHAAQLGSAL